MALVPSTSVGGGSGTGVTQYDYAEAATSNLTVTATTEGGAQTWITGNSVTYDGSTRVRIEVYATFGSAAGGTGVLVLLEDATVIGWVCEWGTASASQSNLPLLGVRYRTPSAGAHTYTVKAFKTGGTVVVASNTGGSGAEMPGYLRVSNA